MTDLKTANQQLAEALAALESNEHDADVREAEAIRNRLIELDGRIGARIQAKLESHRMIATAWREELLAPGQATIASTESLREARATPQWLADIAPGAQPASDGVSANAWQAHHEAVWHDLKTNGDTRYGLSQGQITDPVLETGVAEMPQVVPADEQ